MPSFFGFKNIFNKEYVQRVKKYKKHKDEFMDGVKNPKFKEDVKESAVKSGVDKKEFKRRYFIGQINCLVLFLCALFCVYMMTTSTGILTFMISAFAGVFISWLYFKYNYELWRARIVASKWSQRSKSLTTSYAKYLKAIAKNKKNILPIKVEFK